MKNKTYRFAAALAILLALALVFVAPVGAEAVDVVDANALKAALTDGNPATLDADITLDLGSGTLHIPGNLIGAAITVPDGKSLTITGGTIELPDSPETLTNLICATEVTKSITLIDVVITGNVTDSIILVSRVDPEESTDRISLTLERLTVTTSSKFVFLNDVNSIHTIQVTDGTYTANANCPFVLSTISTDVSSNGNFTGVTINSYASVPPRPVVEIACNLAVTFDKCTFTHHYTGDNPDHQHAAAISVSYGGTANIISGDYHGVGLAYGLYVFPSGGTINMYGGNVISDHGSALYAWRNDNPTWDHLYSDPSIINVFGGMITGTVTHLDTNNGNDGNDIDADIVINGGTFSAEPSSDYVDVEHGCYVYENDGKYIVTNNVPDLPTATVTEITQEGLLFALNFTADESTPQQVAYYGDWYADFVLTLSNDTVFNANGMADGYLSGQYDSYENTWLDVPFENVIVPANTGFRIMEYAADRFDKPEFNIKYNDVIEFVHTFNCGINLTDTYLGDNKDLIVTLELKIFNSSNQAENYTIGPQYVFKPYSIVTFNVDDVENQYVKYNTSVGKPADPSKTGFNFGGWYSDSALTTPYDFSTLVKEDITLYAKWTAKQTSNTGTSSSSSSSKPKEETPAAPGEVTVETEVTDGGEVQFEIPTEEPTEEPGDVPADGETGDTGDAPVDEPAEPTITGVVLPQGTDSEVAFVPISEQPAPAGKETHTKKVFEINVPTYEKGKAATVKFQMTVKELEADGKTAADVALWHFDEETGEWTKLVTSYIIVDGIVYFEAITYDFSPFAIIYEDEPAEEPSEEPAESPSPVLGVLAALGAAILLRRK